MARWREIEGQETKTDREIVTEGSIYIEREREREREMNRETIISSDFGLISGKRFE